MRRPLMWGASERSERPAAFRCFYVSDLSYAAHIDGSARDAHNETDSLADRVTGGFPGEAVQEAPGR